MTKLPYPKTADIRVADHGSLFVLEGETERGTEWLKTNLDEDVLRWGWTGFVVEPRYVAPIVEGAIADGLEVA